MNRRKNIVGHQERQQSILFSFCFTFTKNAIIRILVHVFPTAISTIKTVLGKVTVIITSTIPNIAKKQSSPPQVVVADLDDESKKSNIFKSTREVWFRLLVNNFSKDYLPSMRNICLNADLAWVPARGWLLTFFFSK